MKPRALIAFLLLIALALGVIGYLGYEISRNERSRTSSRYQALIAQQLNDLDASFQSQLLSLEQELIQSYDNPSTPPSSPLINHLFTLDSANKLTSPSGPNLPPKAQAFLERTRSIWQSGLQFSQNKEVPPSTPSREKTILGNLQSRSAYTLRSQPTTRHTGWHAWFYDNDVHLLHWMRLPDGSTIGSEVNRPAFLSRLIGSLPSGNSLPDARIILRSATGQPLYEWGNYQPAGDETPVLTLTLAPPLEAWSLYYHSPLVPEPASTLSRPVLINLAGLALAFLIIALWFLRENNRALHLAARRVSFVNQVSHELKTPLTNIRLYTELAANSLPSDDPATKQLHVVTSETGRLSRLINNVLSFARSERNQLDVNPRPLDLTPTLRTTIAHWTPTLAQAGITITTDFSTTTTVLADPDACEQILGNLLSNIEKYAAAGGMARIATRTQNGQLRVEVSDDGPGIPSSFQKRIFAPFSRLDSSLTEGTSGTGIGLTIARDLARAMHGDLTLARSNSGAAFHWTLPLENPNA